MSIDTCKTNADCKDLPGAPEGDSWSCGKWTYEAAGVNVEAQ